jgi:hypothetical protein
MKKKGDRIAYPSSKNKWQYAFFQKGKQQQQQQQQERQRYIGAATCLIIFISTKIIESKISHKNNMTLPI